MLFEAVGRAFFFKYYAKIGIPVYRKRVRRLHDLSSDEIHEVLKRHPMLHVEEIDANQYYVASKTHFFLFAIDDSYQLHADESSLRTTMSFSSDMLLYGLRFYYSPS